MDGAGNHRGGRLPEIQVERGPSKGGVQFAARLERFGILLALFGPAFFDGLAEGAGMLAIKGATDALPQTDLSRVRHHHAGPGHGLQHGPVQAQRQDQQDRGHPFHGTTHAASIDTARGVSKGSPEFSAAAGPAPGRRGRAGLEPVHTARAVSGAAPAGVGVAIPA